eukprot:TRINITY_DN3476_c0_g1_i11.p2 TRINITY_DN3476_c0_g1~~TRINITY_DN3476_c0_g1_i11.p2  ORF type:complete len:105 (+),score=8.43 TRINITY_DN3476_c0_g1_i11:243-557(+)
MNHSSFQRALYTFSTPLYGQFNFRHQYEEFPKTTTVGAILMFDISNRASYKNTPNWYRNWMRIYAVSYTHLRAHETDSYLVCRLLLEKKKNEIHSLASCFNSLL